MNYPDLQLKDGEPLPEGFHQCMQCGEVFDHEPLRVRKWPYCSEDCKTLMAERIDDWLS